VILAFPFIESKKSSFASLFAGTSFATGLRLGDEDGFAFLLDFVDDGKAIRFEFFRRYSAHVFKLPDCEG
jgi:hypothetical protein